MAEASLRKSVAGLPPAEIQHVIDFVREQRRRKRETVMSRATRRGTELRRELGLHGQVDALAVSDHLGLVVKFWRFAAFEEMRLGPFIAVANRFEPEWRRWVVAHAVGHGFLHVGNHFWMTRNTDLGLSFEREAEDFAFGLLVDPREAAAEGYVHSWEVAEHFGVPDERVRAYAPFAFQP